MIATGKLYEIRLGPDTTPSIYLVAMNYDDAVAHASFFAKNRFGYYRDGTSITYWVKAVIEISDDIRIADSVITANEQEKKERGFRC